FSPSLLTVELLHRSSPVETIESPPLRIHVDLPRHGGMATVTAHPSFASRHPQANPVSGLVASSPVTSHLHESLQQHRRISVALLPVATNSLGSQRQRFAG